MEQNFEYGLEQSRGREINELGFLCYNLYVNGSMWFPEMSMTVASIKNGLNYLSVLRRSNRSTDSLKMQEARLNEKLTELGCICYNLYVDRKLFNSDLLALCNSISKMNKKLSAPDQYDGQEAKQPVSGQKSVSQSKLKIVCPYGMEPIPQNYKRCICSYRNRSDAKYCARCGSKLYS